MKLTGPQDKTLGELCKLVGAKCAVWLIHEAKGWEAASQYGLTKPRFDHINQLLSDPKASAWVAGAITSDRVRSRQLARAAGSDGLQVLYVFPAQENQAVLLVGGEKLTENERRYLKLLVTFSPPERDYPALDFQNQVVFQPLEIGLEPAYDLQSVLQQVLGILLQSANAEGAFIALRAGEIFIVRAVLGTHQKLLGRELHFQHVSWFSTLLHDRQGKILPKEGWESLELLIQQADRSPVNWMVVPIIVGQRVTGFAAFWRPKSKPFHPENLVDTQSFVDRTAHLIENAIIFSEAARYLQQLALVNELASAASTGADIDHVADRVLHRLRRVFSGVVVGLYFLSSDGQRVKEFRERGTSSGNELPILMLEGSLPGYAIETGKPLRIGAADELPDGYELEQGYKSRLVVPLRYRGKVIGVLDLSAVEMDGFSSQDEQLLVMIASHLAGLIENVRLNDETRKRAENLSLIHQLVQKVVGMTDTPVITQIAATLMAEQFDYDFASILLVNDHENEMILNGIAGHVAPNGALRKNYPIQTGLLGEVYQTGQSRFVDNLRHLGNAHPITGSEQGTEMCVLLQEGERYLGVIDVTRNQPYTFSENDLVTLEALAGVLSSVIMNANRYQQLQMSVRQLEAARETALEIAGDLDLDLLLRRIVRRAREMIGARGAELALVDEHAEIVRTVVSDNPWRDFTGTEVPFMSGVEGKVAVLGEPVVVEDYNHWPGRLYPERHMPYRTVAGIPLTLTGKVIGVLLVSDDRLEHTFRSADLQLLEFFAAQAAIFVRNARLYQEIQERMEAQRQAEMQLVRSARLAAVGEMAAGVAHELNNPLTTVAGFIELVLEELPDEAVQRQDLELVLREARRARGVVRRLLDFSRPGDNLRISTDVNELVSEVLTLVQHLVRTNGVTLSVQLQEELPWAAIDPNQIKQVLLNLVHNALQAMPRGGVLVVQTEAQQRGGLPWLTVSVRDNGMGIAPEDMERIFEPFFTTRPVGSGTGLGLSVSYGIITEHGGVIDVESELGQGSCFTVWLPVEAHV